MMMRPLEAADIPALIALWEASGLTRPWNDPRADARLALDGPTSAILGSWDGGVLIGSIMVGFDGHRGWVYYLAVAPGHRRRGLGRALMEAAETWLRARGAPKLQLMVREGNDAALGFYEALGLERQGVVTLGKFLRNERRTMTATLYGIRNCDTMKKARTWLDGHGVAYAFHDYKTVGIDEASLRRWAGKVGWEVLLNRAGTTFRGLSDADKADLDEAKAVRLMLANPSMIKRPVLEQGGRLLVGFKPDTYVSAGLGR